MKRKTEPAVKITASLNVSKKQLKSITPVIIKWLLVLVSCTGSVFSFLSCFDLPVSKFAVIITAVIFCTAFSLSLNMKPKLRGTASLSASAIFLLLVWILRNKIVAGLSNTVNIYLARIRFEFRDNPLIIIAEPELACRHIAVFICFFTALLCISTVYFVSKEWYAVGLCIPTLILPIAVLMFGLEPDYTAFAAVVAGCAAAIALEISSVEKISSGRYRYASAYSGLAAASAAILCFAAAAAAVKISGYERSEKIDEIYNSVTGYIERGEMKNVINNVVTLVSGDSNRSGAINHGKLGEFDEIYFDGKTVLQVTIPKSDETIYLRGFIGSVYTGNSWKPLPSAKRRELDEIAGGFGTEGLTPILMDGYSLKYTGTEMPKYSFSIKNISAGRDYLYMPYNLVPESVSHYSAENDGGFSGGQDAYFGRYYDPSEHYGYQGLFRRRWNISQTMSADEAAYRRFVYENYLDLPDEFSRVSEIFGDNYYEYITAEESQTGKSTLDEMTVFSRKLYYIKIWLRNNCEYSLSAGKLPSGRDFVDYFLENRRGSCSHFASAAALMCRYAGIPARYVEGYIIKPSSDFSSSTKKGESETVDVTDSRAHAWVEIYIDGFGWYPMEFTSGYGNVRTAIPTETLPAPVSETETEIVSETTFESTAFGEDDPNAASESSSGSEAASEENSYAQSSAAISTEITITSETETVSGPASLTERDILPGSAPVPEEEKKPSVGFGIFGIEGSKKVDVIYDLTFVVVTVLLILVITAVFIVRRRICLALYRRRCDSGEKAAAFASYKKFCRIIKHMKLPDQGVLDSTEYAEMLSDRSPMLSDGTAEFIMQTALKASFGGKALTYDDAREAVFTVSSLAKRYYSSLSKPKRFIFKYIYCLL